MKKLIPILLTVALILQMPLGAFAGETTDVTSENDNQITSEEKQDAQRPADGSALDSQEDQNAQEPQEKQAAQEPQEKQAAQEPQEEQAAQEPQKTEATKDSEITAENKEPAKTSTKRSTKASTQSILASGKCGTNVTWTLYSGGELVISGSGDMDNWDFPYVRPQWWDYRDSITKVTIKSGVTRIGNYAFYMISYDGSNISSVTIPSSVAIIGDYAFYDCNFKTVYIPKSVTSVGKYAFCSDYDCVFYCGANSKPSGWDNNWCCGYNYKVLYSIKSSKITAAKISLNKTNFTYTGKKIIPVVTVKMGNTKLKKNRDYTVSVSNNVNRGKGTVTIKGKGFFKGSKKLTFQINRKKLSKVYLSKTGAGKLFTYNGKKKNVTVYRRVTVWQTNTYGEKYRTYQYKKLKKGRDYSVKYYSGHKKIGKHKIKITLKGNYRGTIKKTFKIVPGRVKNIRVKKRGTSSITIRWNKVKGATGYKVYRWGNSKKLVKTTSGRSAKISREHSYDSYLYYYVVAYKKANGKTYKGDYYVKSAPLYPEKARITLSKSGFGEIRMNFKKNSNYQIVWGEYSWNYDSYNRTSYASVSDYKTQFFRFYNLSSNTRYYFKVREYTYINGKLKVGKWTKKSIVTY